MKSKNKRGRPRTYRKPVLVRLDREAIQRIDSLNKFFGFRSRPETIRYVVKRYFYHGAQNDLDR